MVVMQINLKGGTNLKKNANQVIHGSGEHLGGDTRMAARVDVSDGLAPGWGRGALADPSSH